MVDLNTISVFLAYDRELQLQYLQAIKRLQNEFVNNPTGRNIIRINSDTAKKNFAALKRCIKANVTTPYVKRRIAYIKDNCPENVSLPLLDRLSTVTTICKFLDEIQQYYNGFVVLNMGVMYVPDKRVSMWLLDNNIMLDASGKLQAAYILDQSTYRLAGCEKVLDHSKWTLVNIKVNTTNAGIGRMTNYYEQVNRIVQDCGDSTLVITNKADSEYINVPDSRKAWHYNIVGSNQWRDLQNVVVAQTPNVDDVTYILRYIHYSQKFCENIPSLSTRATGKNGTSRYSFTDPRLEQIRTLHIAETIYQGIKRVNRNMDRETRAVIIMNNNDVIELLRQQLKGCKVETVSGDEFVTKYTKQQQYDERRKDQSYATKFMALVMELEYGKHAELQYTNKKGVVFHSKYKKAAIGKYLGIDKTNIFRDKIMSKTEVITFCKAHEIDTSGQYITLPQNVF